MSAVAYAVVRDEPPTVYAADTIDVLQRLLALEVVARSLPVDLDVKARERMRKALLDERWADAVVEWIDATGVAIDDDPAQAYQKAYACDPTSAFGGIVAFNCEISKTAAEAIVAQQFVEVVVAPSWADGAVEAFSSKQNVRVLECGVWDEHAPGGRIIQQIEGGMLLQDKDIEDVAREDLKVVTRRQPSQQEVDDALLAWRVVRYVKSNAIVYGKDNATLGIGAGQMSRIMSAEIAGQKAAAADLDLNGSAMASDAFFPFRDGIDVAAKLGIKVVIQPGGSMRDQEVIDAADEHGIAMLFTGVRHFRH